MFACVRMMDCFSVWQSPFGLQEATYNLPMRKPQVLKPQVHLLLAAADTEMSSEPSEILCCMGTKSEYL